MSKMTFIPITVEEIVHTTEKAILINYEQHKDGQLWIPRSVLSTKTDEAIDAYSGDSITLYIHDWFAKREGLLNG